MTTLLLTFLITLAIGVPIAFAMTAATFAALFTEGFSSLMMSQKLLTGMDSLPLLAVPGFILAGEIMTKGGMASRLIKAADVVIGHKRNGLSVVTIVAGMFFSAMNGVAAATTAAIGELMIPEMDKKGYKKSYVAALACVIGPLGPIIPPSVIMIIYAVGGGISVGDLFLAGIVPGILLGMSLIAVSFIMTRKMDLKVEEKATLKDAGKAYKEASWSLATPIIVLGGIYGGFFTPTEAAVIAVFYSLFVAVVIYKEVTVALLKEALVSTLQTSCMVMLIIGAASGFGWMVTVTNVASTVANAITSLTTNTLVILLLINLALIAIGLVMDTISAIVVFQTVFIPIAYVMGMDMLHFAAIFVVVVAIGNATPPFGYSLFVAAKISGSPLEDVSKNVIPMVLAMLVVVILINLFPFLSTALPYALK